jgi:hypothetical protein
MSTSLRAALRASTLVLAAALVGACGAPAATTVPGSSAAPTAGPVATPGSTGGAPATAPGGVAPTIAANTPLIDLVPDELGGVTLQKLALDGSDLSSLDAASAIVFEQVVTVLGVESADMTIGVANGSTASVIAIRVTGATAAQIGEAMIAGRTLNATTTREDLTIAGKPVIKVTTTTSSVPFYVYGAGDVSFTIAATDETIVAEALSKLP